jgi:predicted DNA-binding transcriptional regulator AlpA
LLELEREMGTSASRRPYLKLAELIAISGLSDATIRRRIKDGSLPYFQPGGPKTVLLFPPDALERVGRREDDGAVPEASAPATDHETVAQQPAVTNDFAAKRGPLPRWKQRLNNHRNLNAQETRK